MKESGEPLKESEEPKKNEPKMENEEKVVASTDETSTTKPAGSLTADYLFSLGAECFQK